MQNSQNKKTLQIVLIVLVAVLTLGIGYASLSAINLIIDGNATANPSDTNFKVKFLNETGVTPVIEGTPNYVLQNDNIVNKVGLNLPFMYDLTVKLKDYNLLDDIVLDPDRMVNILWK